MSGNTLKIIALIAMTIDHAGLLLFPNAEWMRIVGRIAFPIFAFMIAEGCRYTRNHLRYLLQIAISGVVMQLVFFAAAKSLFQSVFISFTLSITLIYVIDRAKAEKRIRYWLCVGLVAFIIMFLCLGLPELLYKTDYDIDYGFIGILIPVMCYFTQAKKLRIAVFAMGLIWLSAYYGGIQWYCLLAVPLMGMYNYQKGKLRLKNLFYIYYPAHLSILFMLDMIIG